MNIENPTEPIIRTEKKTWHIRHQQVESRVAGYNRAQYRHTAYIEATLRIHEYLQVTIFARTIQDGKGGRRPSGHCRLSGLPTPHGQAVAYHTCRSAKVAPAAAPAQRSDRAHAAPAPPSSSRHACAAATTRKAPHLSSTINHRGERS